MVINKSIFFIILFMFINNVPARNISDINILEVGRSRDLSVADDCKIFKPTIKQARHFFSNAYPVEGQIFTHERYSPCYAKGVLRFSDGSAGEWELSSSGVATFIFTRGDIVTLLYKHNKWDDPFAKTYGLGDEGED